MFFELAANKEVQNKARAEVLDIIQKHSGILTYEAIQEMTYLTQVMNETLRRYPPAGILFRVANENYEIKDHRHVIEKGTAVFIPVYGIHNDSRFYENPEKFDPDRFSPEEVAARHKMAFLPFGRILFYFQIGAPII
jgi:cytochrome P450 family 6